MHTLRVSSFDTNDNEVEQTLDLPEDTVQRSISVDGWDLTIYVDGTLAIGRDSVVTDALLLRTTLHGKYQLTVTPYAPAEDAY